MSIEDLDGFSGTAMLAAAGREDRVSVRLRLVWRRGFASLVGSADFEPPWASAIMSGQGSVLRLPNAEIDIVIRSAGTDGVSFVSSGAPRPTGAA